jgi:hypothetical protein
MVVVMAVDHAVSGVFSGRVRGVPAQPPGPFPGGGAAQTGGGVTVEEHGQDRDGGDAAGEVVHDADTVALRSGSVGEERWRKGGSPIWRRRWLPGSGHSSANIPTRSTPGSNSRPGTGTGIVNDVHEILGPDARSLRTTLFLAYVLAERPDDAMAFHAWHRHLEDPPGHPAARSICHVPPGSPCAQP